MAHETWTNEHGLTITSFTRTPEEQAQYEQEMERWWREEFAPNYAKLIVDLAFPPPPKETGK